MTILEPPLPNDDSLRYRRLAGNMYRFNPRHWRGMCSEMGLFDSSESAERMFCSHASSQVPRHGAGRAIHCLHFKENLRDSEGSRRELKNHLTLTTVTIPEPPHPNGDSRTLRSLPFPLSQRDPESSQSRGRLTSLWWHTKSLRTRGANLLGSGIRSCSRVSHLLDDINASERLTVGKQPALSRTLGQRPYRDTSRSRQVHPSSQGLESHY
jgi:hypothetical protein